MIPNILYTITRGIYSNNNPNNENPNNENSNNENSNNENSNNNPNSNSNNNNPNNSNNNINNNPNNDNNDENDIASRSIHVSNNSHFAQLEQQIASQLREQSQELQQQQQQQVDGQTSTIAPTSANQSIFTNNFRLNQPVCILRAPEDSDFPSASEIQQSSAMFFPPTYAPPLTGSGSHDNIEAAKDKDGTSNGIFADKYSLNVIPSEENNNLFLNRISYNTYTNAYYENGDLSRKYLKNWKEGAYQCDNIEIKIEYDWLKTYLARSPNTDKMNDDGEISWKFNYRNGGYLINSLKVRLVFGTFDNDARVQWFIKPLPTMKNQDPSWKLIQFEPYTERRHIANEIKDLTQFVKSEYGFILKAHLSGGEQDHVIWQKTQLFRQDWNSKLSREKLIVENDDTFGFDVKVELRPDIIVDPLPELSFSNDESNISKKSFVLNDESSDFVIHYKVSSNDYKSNERKFYAHSKVLSRRSDYFSALLESKMIESQNKSLTLTDEDITYESLEIILNYMYKGDLPNIKTFDEWTTLLRYASRFLIPTLIQRCEKALKGFLNHNNLDEIESIANEYGAEQLLQCCKKFEPSNNNLGIGIDSIENRISRIDLGSD